MFEFELENESGNLVNVNDGVRYQIIHISGLNPPSASIFTAKSPNRKGVKYNGSTLNERNIIVSIKLLGDIEENRNALYEWVDTEQYCKVHYRNGLKKVYCEGHIQDCEIDMFTDNEIVNVAILCENPYWKDLVELSKEISTLLKQFVLPFAIDSEGVPFSTIQNNNSTNIFNSGAETGVRITIKCNGDVENLMLFDSNDTSKRFLLKTTLLEAWQVVIDTEASPRTVKAYKPDGTVENLLKYTNNPTWFVLKKGNNVFGYTADSGIADVELHIGYTNKSLGV